MFQQLHPHQKIEELRQRGVDDNITEQEKFTVETAQGEFTISVYLQRAKSPLLRVRFISKAGEQPAWNSQEFVRQNFQVGDVLKLVKVGPRRLKVVAKNDNELIQINNAIEVQQRKLVENKLFISVRSNWNDNTELLGHYNILDEKYHITPLLKFMLTAKEHPAKPFFLILDEMNLSRVEHYFSDFLSCLESRVMVDGNLKQENIHLHSFSSYANSDDIYFDAIPNSIEVPLNLYVTGTVNIDETTYTFSPKVLDRANVIEFNEVQLSSYNGDFGDEKFVLSKFPAYTEASIATGKDYHEAPTHFKKCIADLLEILKPYNLHFGYRVINEMSLFINNSLKLINPSDEVIKEAIDIQISQKVLPKLNGAFGKLDEPLRKLITYMEVGSSATYTNVDLEYIDNIDYSKSDFSDSLEKLCKLYKNLVFNGFASYLE